MQLVIDTSVVIGVLIKNSLVENLIYREDLDLWAPEFLWEELEKHKEELIAKTHREIEDFDFVMKAIKRGITIVPREELEQFKSRALQVSPDKNDSDFFALALKLDCPLWTYDGKLSKQKAVKTYDTKQLIEKLKN